MFLFSACVNCLLIAMPTIALFGATGGSGSEFLNLALDAGHTVRALARTPDKLEKKSDRLTVVQGTFSDADKAEDVVTGADYVVVMGGAVKNCPQDMMFNFVKLLHPIMQKAGTKVFFYQAGALNPAPGTSNPFKFKFMRATLARGIGLEPQLKDHDNVLRYISTSMTGDDIKVIVSRPGAGGLQKGESKKKLEVVELASMTPTMYIDLAQWSLEALTNESLYGKFPYPE